MKILLIMPDAGIHRLALGAWGISFREAPLTLTTLAALVPAELNASVRLVDESIEPLPSEKVRYDLVGISCLTGTATRAYAIADRYRKAGVPVILGGVHVGLRMEEAREHADSIVVGDARSSWPGLLRDFSRGTLQPVYRSKSSGLDQWPTARRDLQRRFGYMTPYTVMATRGCRNTCDFCSIPAARYGWHTRPVAQVIDEIASLPARRFVFNDVSLLEDRSYAMELFSALAPLKKVWGGLCTTRIGDDDEMLELMARSGCIYLLIGFESVRDASLEGIGKAFNRSASYPLLMAKLHAYDIVVQGCFIFGLDGDGIDIFEQTTDLVDRLKIDIPRYAIYTPYPGTTAFDKLQSQGRILHEDWRYYDTQHVVYRPAGMTVPQLDEGFRRSWEHTYGLRSIRRRTLRPSRNALISVVGNLAYRRYISRLRRDGDRIKAQDENSDAYTACAA
ncbi:MAG: B12-binding domain-containing radical SAM protein [Chitinispirillaceae bacterium]|nr:B12-binding domain-containing radical SAM protein [Chitinispirillaceae bacterium]